MTNAEKLYSEAIEFLCTQLIDRYGLDQALEIHLMMDSDPTGFFDGLTFRLAELSPESFCPEGIPEKGSLK